jgi:hypothetical protein
MIDGILSYSLVRGLIVIAALDNNALRCIGGWAKVVLEKIVGSG